MPEHQNGIRLSNPVAAQGRVAMLQVVRIAQPTVLQRLHPLQDPIAKFLRLFHTAKHAGMHGFSPVVSGFSNAARAPAAAAVGGGRG